MFSTLESESHTQICISTEREMLLICYSMFRFVFTYNKDEIQCNIEVKFEKLNKCPPCGRVDSGLPWPTNFKLSVS